MTTPQYIPGAEPFFHHGDLGHHGNRVGCLLLHGFTGTPNEMRELGMRLHSHGYTVLGPALAGHATKIEDMIPSRWDDWYRTATQAYDQLAQTCDTIFPIGLSLGGMLALHLAAHRPVAGVVGLSTPSSVDHWRILPFRILPPLFHFFPTVKKNLKRSDARDPNLNTHHLRYLAYPTLAAASMIRDFFPHVMSDLRDVRAPALLLQARGDRVVPRASMETLSANLGSLEKEMVWLERGGHQALEDMDKETAFEQIARFIQRHVPTAVANPTELRTNVIAEPATR